MSSPSDRDDGGDSLSQRTSATPHRAGSSEQLSEMGSEDHESAKKRRKLGRVELMLEEALEKVKVLYTEAWQDGADKQCEGLIKRLNNEKRIALENCDMSSGAQKLSAASDSLSAYFALVCGYRKGYGKYGATKDENKLVLLKDLFADLKEHVPVDHWASSLRLVLSLCEFWVSFKECLYECAFAHIRFQAIEDDIICLVLCRIKTV